MSLPRSGAYLGAALLLASPLACKNPGTNVTVADPDGGTEPGGEAAHTGPIQPQVERRPVEKIEINGSLVAAGDMLDAASQIANMWSPPEPGMPAVNLRDFISLMLIQEGFGPGFFESIDLSGVHAFEFGFPHENQPHATDADVDLALSLASTDPVRAIESMPQSMQPQPLGDNLWQLIEDEAQLFFRAQARAIEIGASMEALDVAHGLPAKVQPTPRIRATVTNLPPGDIDVSEMIPMPFGWSRVMSSILNETTSVDWRADFGTDRDLTARLDAAAPFERLGLDPVGPATTRESELAKTLPGDAILTAVMPWGDPGLLHNMLDKVPVDEIPAPFDSYVDEVVAGLHGTLATVEDEVLFATYVDNRGNVSLVLAAQTKDEAAMRKALREVWTAADKAFTDHIALVGNSPDHRYTVDFKKDGAKAGKFKGDLFTLTVPKDMHGDFDELTWLVGNKPKLEVATVVADGKVVVAIGAGQKQFMNTLGRRLGKAKDGGLEAGGGLALARTLSDGCQFCIAVDPVEVGDLVLTIIAADPEEDKAVRKLAKDSIKKLDGLGFEGEVAFALRLDAAEGVLGFGVPKTLLFPDAKKVAAVLDIFEALDEADAPPDKPDRAK